VTRGPSGALGGLGVTRGDSGGLGALGPVGPQEHREPQGEETGGNKAKPPDFCVWMERAIRRMKEREREGSLRPEMKSHAEERES